MNESLVAGSSGCLVGLSCSWRKKELSSISAHGVVWVEVVIGFLPCVQKVVHTLERLCVAVGLQAIHLYTCILSLGNLTNQT